MQPSKPCEIAIMAKAPISGYCKTRLIPHIGASEAARVQRRLLHRTIETAVASQLGKVTLWCTPEVGHLAFIKARQKYGVTLSKQLGNDLGQRMLLAIKSGLKAHTNIIVLGTDCPALTVEHLQEANRQLANVEHVFQPAEDGGYVMVGSRTYDPRIFRGVPWGSNKVMNITRSRLRLSASSFMELPELWDVDVIADLKRARNSGLPV